MKKAQKSENVLTKENQKLIEEEGQQYLQSEIKQQKELVYISKISSNRQQDQLQQDKLVANKSSNYQKLKEDDQHIEIHDEKNSININIDKGIDPKSIKVDIDSQSQSDKLDEESYDFETIDNQKVKHLFHLFVNKKSGNQSGIKLLQIPNLKLEFQIKKKIIKKKVKVEKEENLQKNQPNADNEAAQQNKEDLQIQQVKNQPENQIQQENQVIKNINEDFYTEIYFYDLYNEESKQKGFDLIKKQHKNQVLTKESRVYCLVAGGDGSVLWLVDEMSKAGIDFDRIPVGMIPVGTGNDFSRAAGWGPDESITGLINNNYKRLQKLILGYIHARVEGFDLWDFHFETYDGGHFQKVYTDKKGKHQKKMMVNEEDQKPIQYFNRTMSNYFSIGTDARVGLNFDKKRTQSRSQNKLIYCCEGIKKFFQKTNTINDTLDSLIQVTDNQVSYKDLKGKQYDSDIIFCTQKSQQLEIKQPANQSNQPPLPQIQERSESEHYNSKSKKQSEIQNKKSSISKKEKQQQQQKQKQNQEVDVEDKLKQPKMVDKKKEINRLLKGKPFSLVVLNIDSYAAGTQGIWKGSKKNHGIYDELNQKKPLEEYNLYEDQRTDDKKLEIIAFTSLLSIPLEKILNGRGKRIAQGKGPFIFKYKPYDQDGNLIQSYFQIDGEYYGALGVSQITVSLTQKVKGGQIKVLKFQKY